MLIDNSSAVLLVLKLATRSLNVYSAELIKIIFSKCFLLIVVAYCCFNCQINNKRQFYVKKMLLNIVLIIDMQLN